MPATERRSHPRYRLRLPAKLRCAVTGRYLTAATCDLSQSGVLLDVDHPSVLVHGQRVEIGIAAGDHDALLRNGDFLAATVVRSRGFRQQQQVALSFDQPAQHRALGRYGAAMPRHSLSPSDHNGQAPAA